MKWIIVGQLGGSGEAQEGDSGFGESCGRVATVEMSRATAITATRRGGGGGGVGAGASSSTASRFEGSSSRRHEG
jgi:hypothetical protein